MATEHVIRASDSDREHTVEALRGQFTEGRLTLEEFDERTSAAYEAKTWTDLRSLTSDLPVKLGFDGTGPTALGPVAAGPVAAGPALWRFAPLIPLAFVAFAAFVVASAGAWHHHRYGVFPFPVIPLTIFGTILAWRLLGSRRRRPWR